MNRRLGLFLCWGCRLEALTQLTRRGGGVVGCIGLRSLFNQKFTLVSKKKKRKRKKTYPGGGLYPAPQIPPRLHAELWSPHGVRVDFLLQEAHPNFGVGSVWGPCGLHMESTPLARDFFSYCKILVKYQVACLNFKHILPRGK